MEEMQVLEQLFDRKVIEVLKLFFRYSNRQFYLQELSRESGVPIATASRILAKLERLEILDVQTISRFRLYRLKESKKVDYLAHIFKENLKIIETFVEKARSIKGITTIILHGKEQKDRASVLLIGTDIDPGAVKELCADIKEKHSFVVSTLSLTEEQYEQMSQMGLYSGQKKVLYDQNMPR
jgi:hypothetical protein